jgi:hypothetical protein
MARETAQLQILHLETLEKPTGMHAWSSARCLVFALSTAACLKRKLTYSQHFILVKRHRNPSGKENHKPTLSLRVSASFVLHLSDTLRVQVCVNNERLRQNHFIFPYFSFKTKPQLSFLQMAKF